jgi:hypothetical protein
MGWKQGDFRALVFAAAVLILLAASTRAWVIPARFVIVYNNFGFFVNFGDGSPFGVGQHIFPLGKGMQVVGFCNQHIQI